MFQKKMPTASRLPSRTLEEESNEIKVGDLVQFPMIIKGYDEPLLTLTGVVVKINNGLHISVHGFSDLIHVPASSVTKTGMRPVVRRMVVYSRGEFHLVDELLSGSNVGSKASLKSLIDLYM